MTNKKSMRLFKRVLATVAAGVLCLLLSATTVMTAYAAAPGSVGPWATSSNTLPESVMFPASTTYNGYVYVVGGYSGTVSSSIHHASLNPDGSVGAWTSDTLPSGLYGTASVAYDGHIYIMGGSGSGGVVDAVYSAPLNPDGSVGTWTTSPNSLPQGVTYVASAIYNGYVYVIGGYGASPVNTIYSAPLNPDGSVGTWTTSANPLPQSIYSVGATAHDGHLYVVGGEDSGANPVNTVYSAPLSPDGSVGTWTTSPNSLPQSLYGPGTVAHNGYLFVMGGAGNTIVNTVYSAPLNPDGSVGTWTTSANPLPQGLANATAVTYNGYVYIMGGSIAGGSFSNQVYYALLTGATIPASGGGGSAPGATTSPKAPDTGAGLTAQDSSINVAATLVLPITLIITGLVCYGRDELRKRPAFQVNSRVR